MTNPSAPPLKMRGSVNNVIVLSSITRDPSVGHETAVVSAAQASPNPGGDDKSIFPQRIRTRDRVRNFFRPAIPEVVDKKITRPESKINQDRAARVDANKIHPSVNFGDETRNGGPSATEMDLPRVPSTEPVRAALFPRNVGKPEVRIALPKMDERIEMTSQLVLCLTVLAKDVLSSPSDSRSPASPITLSEDEQAWIMAIEQNPVKKLHIRLLGSRMVEEFIRDTIKGSVAISEVILLGPVLDRAHHRKLLTCFIREFEEAILLDVDLLQGLVQLLQCASPGYLVADDLIKILSILRKRLKGTHQQSSEHQYHLTLAVSRLLDVMAEPEHKVQDLPRVAESEPLASVLSELKTSSDPYLMYQALYAFQALQYVPDDESAVQAVLRHSLGAAESLIKVSGVIQLNFDGLLEGLKQMQKTVEETYGIAKSGCEGVRSLIDSGRGLLDSLRTGLLSGYKHPWYPAILSATAFCRTGQLEDLGKLIREAPCRRDSRFQWGVSQLLGEIAIDPVWEPSTREQAILFLGDLYMNDTDWGQDDSVKSWMRTIIGKISETSEHTTQETAQALQQVLLEKDSASTTLLYPLRSRLPIPASFPLLNLVHELPYIEDDLDNLRFRRLKEYNQTVYIPPLAKANLRANDKDTQPLMQKVKEFLDSDGQVFLVLGDSGAGKSTFNRYLEHELWNGYKHGDRIPLFINLPAIDRPEYDLIGKQLRNHNFSDPQIQEMKLHRQIILICDGYDEIQLNINLHKANMLNQEGQSDTKMIVSCRSTFIEQDYRDLFQPQQSDRYSAMATDLYTEAVIVPFSSDQIEDYVSQFVRDPEVHKLMRVGIVWSTEDYMDKLRSIPNLMELVKNPFLLTLSLRALPSVVKGAADLAKVKVTRLTLYDSFINQWLEVNRLRLRSSKLMDEAESALQALLKEGFAVTAIDFLKDLAAAIFLNQEGNPVVQYKPRRDKGTWKVKFFGPESDITLLRESSPLSRAGHLHRFIHRSLLEYFYSRHIHESSETEQSQDIASHPLSQRNLVKEPSIVQFLAEHVQDEPAFKQELHKILERSKIDANASRAAANAITILVRAGVLFNGADLKDIQVPGADLSGGQFDSAQLQGADLRSTHLRNIWLRQADLNNTHMADVQFGEWPHLGEIDGVSSCAFSQDGKTFAVSLENGDIGLYDTATWEKAHTLKGHRRNVTSAVFSPSGQQIASSSDNGTVQLWDTQTGAPGTFLRGHSGPLVSFAAFTDRHTSSDLIKKLQLRNPRSDAPGVSLGGYSRYIPSVVFSPNGLQIASGSFDNTVQLWDAQTGAPGAILDGHTGSVTSVVFSPNGQQIASGSVDNTVRLWDAQTGAPGVILTGHTDSVTSVVFSPNGQQIASGSVDNTVRLWDAQTGAPGAILSGHTNWVSSVAFSPNGQQIASGSGDNSVWLWDANTCTSGAILNGHTRAVTSVVFSPSGQQIASGSNDKTVRLWDAHTSAPDAILSGHTRYITSVVMSPSGQQIASGSGDNTVRLWDVQTGAPGAILSGHTDRVMSVMFSPNGQQIASSSGDSTVRLWDVQTGAPGAILDGHTGSVTSVVFSPNGQQIASSSDDHTVRLWDAQTGAPGPILSGHTGHVMRVVFSPNGEQIASGSDDYTVRLWNAETGESDAILNSHTNWITSVVFSPNGQQIASGSGDSTVRLWDVKSNASGAILSGHTDWITSVVFSPNGQQIASSSDDCTVRLWDTQTGATGAILSGHTDSVMSAVFSPSGQQIASGSADNTARLWDVKSGRCLAVVGGLNGTVGSIAWNAIGNGRYFATGCHDKSVCLWYVIDEEDYQVRLYWSSVHDRLNASNTSILNAQGLSSRNMKLLEQRGAAGTPILLKGL